MKTLIKVFILGTLISFGPLSLAQNTGEVTGSEEATDVATQAGSPECDGNCSSHLNNDPLTENAQAAQRRAQGDLRTGSSQDRTGTTSDTSQ